jgi:tetratricopeptide (TPR) repeat protein
MNSPAPKKTGRNDPCPCGSGRKYKACCFQEEAKFRTLSAPDIPAWLQLAQQAAGRGDFTDAEFWFQRVLNAKPGDAHALAGVGQCLCWRGKRREGAGHLLRAAKQLEKQAAKTRDPAHLIELSGQLQHWGEMDAAVRLAQLAVQFAPKSAQAQNNLALALSRVNRVEEALPAIRTACELLPNHPGCQILLAILDSRQGRLAEARKRLEQVIAINLDAEQTARAWLELATIVDKLKDYDKAFAALTQAAALHRALPQYQTANLAYIFDNIATNKAGFSPELLQRWTAEDVRQDGLPAPAFLIGFLRSGTTLTEQVLGAHPQVMASDESSIVFELTVELARLSGIPQDVPAGLRKVGLDGVLHLRKLYWNRVREEYGEAALGKVFVDKNAMNTIELGLISVVFPDAKILFALRDPRDICISCFMQAFSPAPVTVNLLSWEGIGRQYAAVMDFWLALRGSIAPPYLELRYEDTVQEFEATYRRVFAFLGLEWREDVISFHNKAVGRYISTPSFAAVSQPLYATAVARWTRYAKHFAPVQPMLDRFIQAFGYGE